MNTAERFSPEIAQVIYRLQSNFIVEKDRQQIFGSLLTDLLELTQSAYGFIGEVLYSAKGQPYLKTFDVTNIAWNEETRAFYDAHAKTGLEFHNLKSLLGVAITTGEPVISQDPANDPRRGGLPTGHPPLEAYLGVPVFYDDKIVAMMGLANRPQGYDLALVDYLKPVLKIFAQLVVSSQLKEQQTQLQRQLAQFKNTLDQAHDCVFMFDAHTYRFLYVNQGAIKQVGYDQDALLQMHAFDIKSGFTQPQFHQKMQAVIHSETRATHFRTQHQHKQGHCIDVEVFLQYVEPTDDAPHFLAFVRDISEQLANEQEIAETRERFRRGQEYANIGTWEWTIATGDLYWSEQIAPLFGYAKGELETSYANFLAAIHPDDRQAVTDAVAACIEQGVVYDIEHRVVWPDGTVRWLLERGNTHRDDQGKPLKMIGVVQDITALRIAREEAIRANAAKSDFLASMSHELRTPLNSIIGYSQLLELSDLNDKQKKQIHSVSASGKHLLSLINDVLEFAKLESGKLALNIETIDVRPIIAQVVALSESHAQKHNIKINLTPDTHKWQIKADPVRFKQVLLNLTSNGIKYNRPNGKLDINWHKLEQDNQAWWELEVKDTGLGIAEQDLERLFIPFDRLGHEGSTIEGTGIGLSITQDLVEQMGGQITVESEVNVGTRFKVRFPLDQQETDSNSPDSAASAQASADAGAQNVTSAASTLKVLYVEDNPNNMKLMAEIVQLMEGIELRIAPSAENGLQQAQAWLPNLILLDINLPGMNGDEAIAHFRAIPGYTQCQPTIYAVTANVLADQVAHYNNCGFDEVIAKPFDIAQIMQRLEAVRNKQ
ncbi:PAS domain S-box protein [Thiomicrospira microaerophila]|uniref:PAS domain S-box protein n=1 Tax=Thiomicrospira microaerophila TaxID=406020 RepID=UPI0005C8572D|nr:PAS domain S-box protein [Thiomicrospira microaerophila]